MCSLISWIPGAGCWADSVSAMLNVAHPCLHHWLFTVLVGTCTQVFFQYWGRIYDEPSSTRSLGKSAKWWIKLWASLGHEIASFPYSWGARGSRAVLGVWKKNNPGNRQVAAHSLDKRGNTFGPQRWCDQEESQRGGAPWQYSVQ